MIREKIDQAVGILGELDVDVWMTFVRESDKIHDPCIDIVVGGNVTWQSAFIIGRGGEKIAVLGSLDKAAHEELGFYDEIVPYVQGISGPLKKILARLDPGRIALNFSKTDEMADGLSHGQFLALQDILADTPYGDRIVSSAPIVSRLRSRKLPAELERITRACLETVDVFEKLSGALAPGMTEKQIAASIKGFMNEKGLSPAWDEAHCPAVFTGPESAGAHAGPTDRPMEPGHIMNVDFGMRVEGYCSDLQRTWYCRRPGEVEAPEPVKRGFETIREAVRKAAAFMKPGVMGKDVDAVARGHITAAGYEEYPHALGHQIGREAHDGAGLLCPEWERYGDKPYAEVEKGQCYTIEPRLTVPGYGVATIEEIVVVEDDGVRFLSAPQEDLWYIKS